MILLFDSSFLKAPEPSQSISGDPGLLLLGIIVSSMLAYTLTSSSAGCDRIYKTVSWIFIVYFEDRTTIRFNYGACVVGIAILVASQLLTMIATDLASTQTGVYFAVALGTAAA